MIAAFAGLLSSPWALAELAPPTPVEPEGAAPSVDFALRDARGRLRRLADFHGKVLVVTFGYVYCPDVCPTTMATLAEAMRDLGPDASRVQVVFITVDPERDSPVVIGAYARAFDEHFLGLRGNARATAAAARAFDVDYVKQPGKERGRYTVDHTAASYIVDPFGQLRVVIGYGQRASQIANEIRRILAAMPGG